MTWDWDDARTVAFDMETSGELPEYALQPWRLAQQSKFWATSISVIQRQPTGLVPWMSKLWPTVEDMAAFLMTAASNDWTVVTWNGIFDVSILIAYGLRDLVFKVRWLDGMLLWKHLEIDPEYDVDKPKKKSYALKPAAELRFIPSMHKPELDEVDFHSRDPAELAKLQYRNNRDSVRTWVITKLIWEQLTERQRAAALIEAEAIPVVAEANLHGLPVDPLFAAELSAWLKDTAVKRLQDLEPHGLTGPKMVRSPKQLAELMYDVWKLPVLKESAAGNRSTDKEVLYELAFQDPRCKLLRDYREALNLDTKFAQAPLVSSQYNGDGRTRPQAIMFGTYTGRMTYGSKQGKKKADVRQTGFAIHQIKRGGDYRGTLQAPPGYTIVEFDAAGQEYRWMAALSGDPNMMQLCIPGEDPHAFMGARITGKDYRYLQIASKIKESPEEQDRYLGKFANLCIAEGTTILTDRGPCSIEQVRDDDLVWDGEEFVAHDGVSFSGVQQVITYMGVTATLDHKVLLTNGRWDTIEAAERMGWKIEPALGQGWTHRCRSAVRIVDGLVRRHFREVRSALRQRPLRLWTSSGCQFTFHGGGPIYSMQVLRDEGAAAAGWSHGLRNSSGSTTAPACQCVVPAVSQPQGQIISQLRRTWHRVQVLLGARSGGVCEGAATTSGLPQARHRSGGQRRSLRAWQLALGYAQGEPCQPGQVQARTYDIVNCGPRTRFAANGLIVHNSAQYRTGVKTLRVRARVDYEIPIELPQAQLIWRTYRQTYTQVPRYWERAIELAKAQGYAETLAGRRVALTGDWGGQLAWKMESTALNYPVQGTGGDQKYLALKILKDYLIPEGCYFALDLHDGLYWFIPDRIVDRVIVEAKRLLDNLPYQRAWNFTPPVPMSWDAKYGKVNGALKELKD